MHPSEIATEDVESTEQEGDVSAEPSRAETPSVDDATVASELPQDEPPPPEPEVPPPEPEPEVPPPPPKTEDDLWLYLREAVTQANPLNVEELVSKLMDTVKEVPQDFLEPVVEASIKRSQSMELSNLESLPLDGPPAESEPKPEGEAQGEPAPTAALEPTGENPPSESSEPAPVPAEVAPADAPPAEAAPASPPAPVVEAAA